MEYQWYNASYFYNPFQKQHQNLVHCELTVTISLGIFLNKNGLKCNFRKRIPNRKTRQGSPSESRIFWGINIFWENFWGNFCFGI